MVSLSSFTVRAMILLQWTTLDHATRELVTYDMLQSLLTGESLAMGMCINLANLFTLLHEINTHREDRSDTPRDNLTHCCYRMYTLCVCWLMHCKLWVWDCSRRDNVWNWQEHSIHVSKHCVQVPLWVSNITNQPLILNCWSIATMC
jgi:hypothetical protein